MTPSLRGAGVQLTLGYFSVPMAVFSDPEVAMTGHTQRSSKTVGFDFVVNCMPASAVAKAHVAGMTNRILKINADRVAP
ncbi:MAG: hypothetical protein PHI31_04765 [Desulfuromonadaceae bacterium]|nr:hypothetical protein [Desulfuromonadaceae bacterium]